MTEDVYIRLREFMDRLPTGFPETPEGIEIKLLKKMFTPEQAELTMQLTTTPESAADIARRTGADAQTMAGRLEDLAQNGLVFRIRQGDEPLYRAYQFVVGLYEFQLNRMDAEFAELFEAYLPYLGMTWAQLQTDQMRVLPVESSLDSNAAVAPYNQVRTLVEKEDLICVNPCICRKEQGLLGHRCDMPLETCLMFGDWARYYIDNGLGRQIDRQEAFAILDLAEESGLVLRPGNFKALDAICTCCSCCCPSLKMLKAQPNPAELAVTYYQSVVDSASCTGCGTCMEVCPMDAIDDDDGVAAIDVKRCIGCGLCVGRCPEEALSMVELEDNKGAPLETFDDVLTRIAAERGGV